MKRVFMIITVAAIGAAVPSGWFLWHYSKYRAIGFGSSLAAQGIDAAHFRTERINGGEQSAYRERSRFLGCEFMIDLDAQDASDRVRGKGYQVSIMGRRLTGTWEPNPKFDQFGRERMKLLEDVRRGVRETEDGINARLRSGNEAELLSFCKAKGVVVGANLLALRLQPNGISFTGVQSYDLDHPLLGYEIADVFTNVDEVGSISYHITATEPHVIVKAEIVGLIKNPH